MTRLLSVCVVTFACAGALSACGSDGVPGQCSLSFDGSDNADFGDPGIDGLLEATGAFQATPGRSTPAFATPATASRRISAA